LRGAAGVAHRARAARQGPGARRPGACPDPGDDAAGSQALPQGGAGAAVREALGVEVNLRHLKQTLHMDVVRCQTWRGVWKELLVFVIVYNLVRRVMLEASRRQGVEPERISFVDALRWLREARRGEAVPRLRVNPQRPNRVEPRVRKRRPKEYDLMK